MAAAHLPDVPEDETAMDLALSTSALDDPAGAGRTRALVTVAGEVDLESAPELGDHALAALKDVSVHLVLDLGGVTFMDSTGLKVLLATAHRADLAGGSVVLLAPNRTVHRILTLTGLDKTFVMADDLADLPPVTTVPGADLSGDAAPTP
jgi:anti-anti-sigma factor